MGILVMMLMTKMSRSLLESDQKGAITRKFGRSVTDSLESLERFQKVSLGSLRILLTPLPQLFTSEGAQGQEARLMGHAEKLAPAANAALQAMLLVSAM